MTNLVLPKEIRLGEWVEIHLVDPILLQEPDDTLDLKIYSLSLDEQNDNKHEVLSSISEIFLGEWEQDDQNGEHKQNMKNR